MSDLIEREDAIKVLEELSACEDYGVEIGTDEETYIGKYEAITEISDLPSARQQGEWIVLGGTDFNGISYCAKCSNCKAVYDGIRLSNYSYCPHCGADMRGDNHE